MRRLFGLPVFLAVCLTAGCASRSGVIVERLDVMLQLLVDGSVEVVETMQVRFGGTPVTSFRRYQPAVRHDGVFAVSGALDGQEFPPGDVAGHLRVGKGPALDVTWLLPPVSAGTHTLRLTYRAANAIEVSGIRGTLAWRVFDARRDYDLESAHVTAVVPPGAILLEDPWVMEAGWTVERRPNGFAASRSGIGGAESATAGVTFTIDTMAAGEPAWQYNRRRARDLMPAFVSAGLFLAVVGAGIVAMLRVKYPPRRVRPGSSSVAAVAPAMAIALTRGRARGDHEEIQAALRGLDGRERSTDSPLRHERVLVEEQRHGQPGNRQAGRVPRALRRRFRRALEDDLVAAGLIDAERVTVVRDLWRAGWFTVLFGALTWIVTSVTLDQFGRWPLAVPAGVVAAGIMLFFSARKLPILSQNGVSARERVLYSARVRDGRTSA